MVSSKAMFKQRLKKVISGLSTCKPYDGKHQILDDISFSVNKGETIAFVGHTGSGNRLLSMSSCVFKEFQSGRVLLDGVDYSELQPARIEKNIGLSLTEPFSIMDPLQVQYVMYSRYSDDQVKAALADDSFLIRSSISYDAPVSERGSSFSTGQRQLLAFARTVASQPDEATANDSEILSR